MNSGQNNFRKSSESSDLPTILFPTVRVIDRFLRQFNVSLVSEREFLDKWQMHHIKTDISRLMVYVWIKYIQNPGNIQFHFISSHHPMKLYYFNLLLLQAEI